MSKYVKYWNIFTWQYLNLIRGKNTSLAAMNEFSIKCAEKDGHGGSWYDVIDGICWICSIVGALILIGFLMS